MPFFFDVEADGYGLFSRLNGFGEVRIGNKYGWDGQWEWREGQWEWRDFQWKWRDGSWHQVPTSKNHKENRAAKGRQKRRKAEKKARGKLGQSC